MVICHSVEAKIYLFLIFACAILPLGLEDNRPAQILQILSAMPQLPSSESALPATTAEAMFRALELPPPCPAAKLNLVHSLPSDVKICRLPYNLCLPNRRLSLLSIRAQSLSDPSTSSRYTETIGHSSPPSLQFSHCTLTQRHIHVLNVVACATAVSATWLFCSAIPTLLAFKRAAESLEKLMDVTREELPGTMAAIRLSGMEISDLTMELSDLGQDITQGVRSSTRAVRVAEERLRRLTTMSPTGNDSDQSGSGDSRAGSG